MVLNASATDEASTTWQPSRGASTASPLNVAYRLRRFGHLVSGGRWLDFGCADGGYAEALLRAGADEVFGVDVEADRIEEARARGLARARFQHFDGSNIPFASGQFCGVLMNEVLEHVLDEEQALSEIRRVLAPGGTLVLISPNRWFPVEGHGIHVGSWTSGFPVPLVPWLPERLTRGVLEARNYWPTQMARLVENQGFSIEQMKFIWPVLERYPWMPSWLIPSYRRVAESLDDFPVIRRFGVSTMLVASPNTAPSLSW